jgi:hypothetical protein
MNVEDRVDAILHISEESPAAENAQYHFETYEVGRPLSCAIDDPPRRICVAVDPDFEYTAGDRDRIGDNPFVFLDASKPMAAGSYPKYDIDRSVTDTPGWLRNNQGGTERARTVQTDSLIKPA